MPGLPQKELAVQLKMQTSQTPHQYRWKGREGLTGTCGLGTPRAQPAELVREAPPQDADKREWLGTERKTGFERSHMAQICDHFLAMESWALPNLVSSFLGHKTEIIIPSSKGRLL